MKGGLIASFFAAVALAAFSYPGQTRSGYAGSESCRSCHPSEFESYRRVSMSRSFGPIAQAAPIEDWTPGNTFYHAPSKQYFEMSRRDGRFFQRRYQLDANGRRINPLEVEIQYAIGSGNHERDYLHRSDSGELTQLPMVWYAETRSWGMAPGYDNPQHEGFSRRINYRCMFCHASYPALPDGADRSESQISLFPAMPSSIDCERCHGPGEQHAKSGKAADIVNPAKLDRKLQMDVCLQCHLETTSAPLPNSVIKIGRGIFSFRPGEAIESYAAYFDYPPKSGHSDDFNIVHQGYRLRKSLCFAKSSMTCLTCHDPHRSSPDSGNSYNATCRTCHDTQSCKLDSAARATSGDDCVSCHMPKRRTDDIVHVVMTDHYIQRRPPPDLLRPKTERAGISYRGPLSFYLPEPDSELYSGLALARGADVPKGIQLLERALSRHENRTAEIYFQLAAAYAAAGNKEQAVDRYRRGLELEPQRAEARFNMAVALLDLKKFSDAAAALRDVVQENPRIADAFVALGAAEAGMNRLESARSNYLKGLQIDPLNVVALDNLGLIELQAGRRDLAAEYFDSALRVNPNDPTAKRYLQR